MLLVNVLPLERTQEWNDYVEAHQDSTPYHRFSWLNATVNAYGHQILPLVIEDNNVIKGILPLVLMRSLSAKKILCALPFCDVGHSLSDSPEGHQLLVDYAKDLIKKYHVHELEIRGDAANSIHASTAPLSERKEDKVRMLLELPDSSDELWSGFKSKLRSQIRKAEKNGLTASLGTDEKHIKGFYDVIARNLRALGSPVHSYRWYENIISAYGSNAIIVNIFSENKVVGAGLVLLSGNKAAIPWASTLSDYNRLAPNMLLYWTLLKYVTDKGADVFDFGRSTPNEGTYKFKMQWGAIPRPLHWQVFDEHGMPKEVENSIGKYRKMIEAIWRKIPLKMTIILGSLLRKYISL